MDFSFTPQQEALRRAVRALTEREVAPFSAEWDRTAEYPRHLLAKLADVGITDLLSAPAPDPSLPPAATVGIAVEELARGDYSASMVPVNSNLACSLVSKSANAAFKSQWLPPLAQGKLVMALGLTEPEFGSDVKAVRTTYRRDGDRLLIRGEKTSITAGMIADVSVVMAVDPKTQRASLILVDLRQPSVSRAPLHDMGCRALLRASLSFDDTPAPATAILGEEGKGLRILLTDFGFTRTYIALGCVGSAQAALEQAVAYAKQRRAFGKPIGDFQGVAFPLVDDVTALEASRLLCYKALALRDAGQPYAAAASMAKLFSLEAAIRSLKNAMVTYGHYSYERGAGLEQRLRDVLGWLMGDGTPQMQQLVIAREVFGLNPG